MGIYNKPIKGHRTYTKESKEIQQEAYKLLEPLFAKYKKLGYEPNEIHYLINMCITDLALNETLGLND